MTELKKLSEQATIERAKKYPNVPAFAIPRAKFSDSSANGLTQSILKFLQLNGHWATRVSSAGRYLPKQKKFIPSTTRIGTADIHAVIGGRHISIEVKFKKDRQSIDQIKVQAEIEKSGGLYLVARSLDQFVTDYQKLINQIISK